jgi:organic radical activating enzyme
MKVRTFIECNYRAIQSNNDGQTIRFALDPKKPITDLPYPEFYDVKITSYCKGMCSYCYQSSASEHSHKLGLLQKFQNFFGNMTSNQRPFQIAFGGGEPTSHPEFIDIMRACKDLNITPNYTTNGMWDNDQILNATIELCGGVAISSHPHLSKWWKPTLEKLLCNNIHTNIHVIISDQNSIDSFKNLYAEYTGRIKYFVLLPLAAQGRSLNQFTDWKYLEKSIKGSPRDIAFGAGFHPYLAADPKRFNVSIYEPESMSAYLDLETMKIYKSSFDFTERKIG